MDILNELKEVLGEHKAKSPQQRKQQVEKYVTELNAAGIDDATIAEFLNAKGVLSTHGKPLTKDNVAQVRYRLKKVDM